MVAISAEEMGPICWSKLLAKQIMSNRSRAEALSNFLPGVEMEGDTPGREEVEAGADSLKINDSNKCCFLLSPIESPPAVNHDQVEDINAPTAVEYVNLDVLLVDVDVDLLADVDVGLDDNPNIYGGVEEDLLTAADVDIAADSVQDLLAADVDIAVDNDFEATAAPVRKKMPKKKISLGRLQKGVATASPLGQLNPLHLLIQLHLLLGQDPLPLLLLLLSLLDK